MMLKQRLQYLSPAALAPGTNTLLGQTVKLQIDRTWPLEEIIVIVDATMAATKMTTLTTDGFLGILRRVNLSVNDGVQPRSVVDFSGIGLLEYANQVGLNLDAATLQCVIAHTSAAGYVASNKFRIVYRIPLVHPIITEPLRTRMLLDIQNHPQDPTLTLDFATATQLCATNPPATVTAEVILVRREMPGTLNASILGNGKFIPFDLIETPFSVAVGVAGENRFPIPLPGHYAGLLLRSYKGGATVTRDELSETTTAGSESRWRLETGSTVVREFRMKHLQAINQFSQALNSATQASSPSFLGALAANTQYQAPGSVYLDFLTDGLNDANELGSLLDCNLPTTSGLKMELIGSVASVATNASTLYIGGHRYFGDLSKYQALKAA